ncbi:Ankyrin repeat domain-containing protein [Paramyrothecium foliicola]|nr:Ankyrin repeat domain-containing protein [Paramyrothecium foliicola]
MKFSLLTFTTLFVAFAAAAPALDARGGCSCKKLPNGEYICNGTLCPKDLGADVIERDNTILERGCSYMAQKRAYGVQWDAYQDEIIDFYVKQNKTAEDTLQYLREKHGLHVTYKKLSVKDWRDEILPQIRKRKNEGKESDVYLLKKRICSKRVKQEIDRYEAALTTGSPPGNFCTGIAKRLDGSSSEGRICIRTPSPVHMPQPTPGTYRPDLLLKFPSETGPAMYFPFQDFNFNDAINDSGAPVMNILDDVCTGGELPQLLQYPIGITQIPGPIEFSNMFCLSQPKSIPRQSRVSLKLSKAHLLRKLPWFQLLDLSLTGSLSRTMEPTLETRTSATKLIDGIFVSILPKPAGISYGSNGYVMPIIARTLEDILPARSARDRCPRTTQASAVNQTFDVFAFLASNNKMNEIDLQKFLRIVTMWDLEGALEQFLSLKIATTEAFALKLVAPAARLGMKPLLERFSALGVPFDHAAIELMSINDDIFRSFVLSRLTANSLSGLAGTKLLVQAVQMLDIPSARLIIQAGAEINVKFETFGFIDIFETPLIQAVLSGSLEMVQLLVKKGADVNTSNHANCTALGEAVRLRGLLITKYLLDSGASVEGQIGQESIICYAMRSSPAIYNMLRQKIKSADKMLEGILHAAARREALSTFLLAHQITEEQTVMYTRLLLQAGVDPNVRGLLDPILDKDGWENGKASEIVDIVLSSGFDLHCHGHFAVEFAFNCGAPDAAVFLIDRGINFDNFGKYLTPLQAVAFYGSLSLLKDLVNQGVPVNQPAYPQRGLTALQAASLSGCLEKVQYLFSVGADINCSAAFVDGAMALEAAFRPYPGWFDPSVDEYSDKDLEWWSYCYYDKRATGKEIFRFLLRSGAFINRTDGTPSPLLHDILERRLPDILREALVAGASTIHSLGTFSSSGHPRTPVQLAAEVGQLESVKLLVEFGADVNAEAAAAYGRTALQAATSNPEASVAMVKFLLSQGAAVSAPAAHTGGLTALQGAAIQGHINIALTLFEAGANPNEPPASVHGRTAIEGAAEHGRLDMVQLLLNAGAVGDVLEGTGLERAKELALKNNHFHVVDLLESASKGI